MAWLIEQLPSVTGYPPADNRRWLKDWSYGPPFEAFWGDREHAREFSEHEAHTVVRYIGADLVRAVEVDDAR